MQAPDVTREILLKLRPIEKTFPPDYRIEIGGAQEESDKANHSIMVLLPLSAGIMKSDQILGAKPKGNQQGRGYPQGRGAHAGSF